MGNVNKLCAEALGTFTLLFVGSLTILSAAEGDARNLVIGVGFGFALLMGLHLWGSTSGGHFNPAVSLGAFLSKRLGVKDLIGYWVAQAVGAIVASVAVLVMFDGDAVASTATTVGGAIWPAIVAEVLLTALFVGLILKVTSGDGKGAFIAIPLALVAIQVAAIPISGASVNPARSLGPALVGGAWGDFWLYLVGPALGAVLGAAMCKCCSACKKS
ncbi:MAG: aquaporin [Thermoleophilia bacterium]|nr:aquaporin [Thermoleophilia bacterium]